MTSTTIEEIKQKASRISQAGGHRRGGKEYSPEGIREEYPGIPWSKIAGMRDVLIHEYSGGRLLRKI